MPEDVVLPIEVAITSEERDTGEKALLYAQAGVTDYWVVLPEQSQVIVHREPTADGYGSVMTLGAEKTLMPLAMPEAVLSVCAILGP